MPVDVALLGCGHPHLADVLGVLASEPSLRLAAVWEEDASSVPGAISGALVGRAETAIRRADAVVILAPTDRRPALCSQAARAGRPLLVTTPLARTAGEAAGVAREVARSRTPAEAALPLRELPALARLRAALQEGLLGRLSGVDAVNAHPGALDGWFTGPTAWMRDRARAGVGGFGDLALHLLDALARLPAEEPPSLAAVALDRRDGTASRGDVGGSAVGRWAGVPLTVRAGWASRPGGLELRVTGASGTATVREGVLEIARATGTPERWVGAPPDAGEALRAFGLRLATGRLPRDGLAGAVAAQRAVEGAVVVG
jgi:predicted dehydrogenase